MTLDGVLTIGMSGLADINRQFALLSHNVANASTAGYAVETAAEQSLTADGTGMGVRTAPAQAAVDTAVQTALYDQNATVAGLQTQQAALSGIDTVQGTPGQGDDLGSLLGSLQDAFTTLATDPSSASQQAATVAAANTLVQQLNTVAGAVVSARQSAQDSLGTEVGTLNSTLATIGGLNTQIVQLQAAGQSTADLVNQRTAAIGTLSSLVNVKVAAQSDGSVQVFTPSGLSLPLSGGTPFSIGNATLSPSSTYPATVPGIMLGGTDVTANLAGGQIGANVQLRDTTLPTYQGELDEFAYTLSSRFAQQGLTLFTTSTGATPSTGGLPGQQGYVGLAATMEVNPAVTAQPSLVRDGTNAVAGSATGASAFTPNPTGGPAGFATLITRVLNYALGAQAQDGVTQPAPLTTGLGADGTLSAPFSAPATLADFATDVVAGEAQDSSDASTQLTTEQGVQTTLQTQLSSATGVNMDQELSQMVELQNAYSANAKVISTVQSLYTDLLNMVQ